MNTNYLFGLALHEALLDHKYGDAYKRLTPTLQQTVLTIVENARKASILLARRQYVEAKGLSFYNHLN